MLVQVLSFLSNPPGSFVYHFVVFLSIEAALAMAFSQWLRERESGTARLTIALLVVGLARAVLAAIALMTYQEILAPGLLLPPVERLSDTLIALGLMWAFVTIDDPIVLRRNTVADVVGALGLVAILAGGGLATTQWLDVAAPGVTYNGSFYDLAWGTAQIAILVLGLLWMVLRIRYVSDTFLKALIFVFFVTGVALHLYRPPLGDAPAATRLGLVIGMPLLATVTYRHVVAKLLAFDSFLATPAEPVVMPQAVADAITPLPFISLDELSQPEILEVEDVEEELDVFEDDFELEEAEEVGEEVEEEILAEPEVIPLPAEQQVIVEPEEAAPVKAEPASTGELPPELAREIPNAVQIVESLTGLVASLDVRDAANHIARAIASALRADVALIISLDEKEQVGVVVGAYDNITQTFLEGGTLPFDEQETMVNALGRLRQMRLTPQRNMRELRHLYKMLGITHTGPTFIQPLHSGEHRLGVLVVGSPYAKVSLSNAERTLFDRMGSLVTAALMNASSHYEVSRKVEDISAEAERDLQTAQARASLLEKEVEEARKRAQDLTTYAEDLEQKLHIASQTNKEQHETRIAELEGELADTQGQWEEAQRKFEGTQRELDETRTASQVELGSLRARLSASVITQTEVSLLQEQLMAKAREVISLQLRINEAQITSEALRRQLESTGDQAEMDRLQARTSEQAAEIAQLQQRLAEAEASVGLEFDSFKQQADMEAADREAATHLQSQLAIQNKLIEALEVQLAEKSRALASVHSNVGDVDDSLRALEQQLRNRTAETAALQSSLEETRKQARERIEALSQQLSSQAADADTNQQLIIEQLEAELAEKSDLLTNLESQLGEANDSLSRLEAQLATTSAAVESAVQEARNVDTHEEVIASLAQELRTPMSSIVGYTDLLLGESVGIIGALQRKFLQKVRSNTERMAALLDNLISITSLDSDRFHLAPEKVDVTSVLQDAVTATVAQFQEKNLTLRIQIADDLPAITADRDGLDQIVTHLLTNASLASPVEGEVMLTAGQVMGTVPGPDGDERETPSVFVSVTDSGSGIKPEDQERVFLRMYRADNPLIDGLGDTGVALSIAKTLIDAHGGRIWLESEDGVGTTFNVLLPVEPVAEAAPAAQA